MTENDAYHCVGVFGSHEDAERAIRDLQAAGVEMNKLSIIGRDYHTEEHPVGFYNTGDRVKYWGKQGTFWGSILGLLFAPAFFWIPGIGPVLTGGIIGSALMGAMEGAAVGAVVGGGVSVFAAALGSLGIPKDTVIKYEADIKASKFLLIFSGSEADTTKAQALLSSRGATVQVHPSAGGA